MAPKTKLSQHNIPRLSLVRAGRIKRTIRCKKGKYFIAVKIFLFEIASIKIEKRSKKELHLKKGLMELLLNENMNIALKVPT